MYKIIVSTLLIVGSFNVQAESRFSIPVEYEIMRDCAGNGKPSKIEKCGCALTKAKHVNWGSDWNDDKYREDTDGFDKAFEKASNKCNI